MSVQGLSDGLTKDTALRRGSVSKSRGASPKRGQRKANGTSLAIIVSLILHAGVAAYLVTTQFVLKAPEVPETEAILVSMGPLDVPNEPEQPQPPKPPVEVKPLIQPRPTPAPIFQDVQPLPLPPVKPEAEVRVQPSNGSPVINKGPSTVAAAPKSEFVGVDVDMALTNNPPPPYPPQAKARREEGTVVLRLKVLGDGSVGDVQVQQSSGSQRLDRAAVDAVKRWHFKPATQGGKSVESWATVPITFGFKKRHGDRHKGGPEGRDRRDRDDRKDKDNQGDIE